MKIRSNQALLNHNLNSEITFCMKKTFKILYVDADNMYLPEILPISVFVRTQAKIT